MLNLKKVIASICVIALALSTVTFAASYTDVAEDSAYYEAVETLSKLNIVTGYEDGSYKPEATVTRAEMAALIARIQGYEETAKANAETIFTDVAKEHWASGYVAQAANQGIINGYGDGTFGPEDTVTYEQAVKMIMATLGFTPYANFNGGYPTGYLTAATRYGVTDGVSNAVVGTGANRGTIAQLLNNAIDTPLMVQNSWSTNGEVEFVVYDGSDKVDNLYKTLMSEYLGVVKLKGVVVENSVIDLDAAKNIKTTDDAEVIVDVVDNFSTNHKDFQSLKEYTFLVGESDADDYIGKAVVLYVTENDDDEYEVVSIAADSTKNDTVEITLDQFVKYDAGNGRIHYVETVGDDDDIYEAFEKAADGSVVLPKFVYNGKGGVAASAIFNANVVKDNGLAENGGLITMIDNDSVKGIDVVFVEVAATAVVDEVEDGVVIFKDSAKWDAAEELFDLDFEKEADDTIIVLTKDGEEIAYTDLQEWDAISIIAKDDSGKGYIRAEVISNAVEGTITAKSKSVTSYNNEAFTIAGTKYDVIEGYGTTNLEVGDAGTFYIDKYGKIAAFNEDSAVAGAAGSYAYIINMVGDEDIMGEKQLTFMLLTADGIKQVNAATRIKLSYAGDNDATCEVANLPAGASNATQVSSSVFGGNLVIKTVVKYTLNSKGEVNTITTANHDDKFEATAFTPDSVEYEAEKGYLGKFIDEDATIFFVDTVEAKKSVVGTVADLADGNYYNVAAIYADRNAIDNNIFVVEDSLNQIAGSAAAAIVTGISHGLDEEGAQIFTLSYVEGNEEKEATSIEDCTIAGFALADITPGDIVKVKVNAAGNITKVDMVVDFADGGRKDNSTDKFSEYVVDWAVANAPEEFVGGPVAWAKKGGKIQFNTDGSLTIKNGTGDVYGLDKAETISVVEFKANGAVSVKRGSASSFKVFEDLYDGVNDKKIYNAETDAEIGAEGTDLTLIEEYTDHVFCRSYDGKLLEVVIVKAPVEIRVK